jgi:mRNA interferase RelE/StbE
LGWQIKSDDSAKKDSAKLDKQIAKRVTSFMREREAPLDNPRSLGDALKGSELGEFWKYRVGGYQIIASIEDSAVRILVVKIGNRREVYR